MDNPPVRSGEPIPLYNIESTGTGPEGNGLGISLWEVQESKDRAETAANRLLLADDLAGLGVDDPDRVLDRYDWVRVAWAVRYVRQHKAQGQVNKPAGLVLWRIKNWQPKWDMP